VHTPHALVVHQLPYTQLGIHAVNFERQPVLIGAARLSEGPFELV
jgi:hypothetical protein